LTEENQLEMIVSMMESFEKNALSKVK